MKAVAETLAVARSNLIERVSRRAKSRRPYRKAGDDELLVLIRRLWRSAQPTDIGVSGAS
jgi:putative transposase